MQILCLSYEYPPLGGGGARVVHGLVRALAAAGDRIDLVTMGFRRLPRSEIEGPIQVRRIAPLRLRPRVCSPVEMIPYVALATGYARSCVGQKKYALIHAHFIFPDGLIAYLIHRMTGLPYAITAHGSDVPGYNPDRFASWHAALRPLWMRVTSAAEAIVCPSRRLQSLVRTANARARIGIIPNGFDSARFVPRQKRDQILVVTRMFARKGVQHLLRAMVHVPASYRVLIVGDGPELAPLRRLARELRSRADFLGALDNDSPKLKELYETSRIFVLPSEAENFPVVLLEAMAAGCAIITTEDTGCEEVIGADAAVLVKPGDVAALAEALRELTGHRALCARLGEAARKRLQQRFEWPLIAAQYRALYRSMDGTHVTPAARCGSV